MSRLVTRELDLYRRPATWQVFECTFLTWDLAAHLSVDQEIQ
jgi:hypothetical protein